MVCECTRIFDRRTQAPVINDERTTEDPNYACLANTEVFGHFGARPYMLFISPVLQVQGLNQKLKVLPRQVGTNKIPDTNASSSWTTDSLHP